MILTVELSFRMYGIHKQSGNEICFTNSVKQAYEEGTEDFKEVIKFVEDETGMKREKGKEYIFDKKLCDFLVEKLKEEHKLKVDKINDIIRQRFLDKCTSAIIEFGGYIINVSDFSAFRFGRIESHISKN